MDTWFISDLHFGHKNILEYEPIARPFKDLQEMNEAIINRWNATVKPQDKVWVLGDFAFGAVNVGIARILNGKKHLVMGNHDKYPSKTYLEHFEQLHGTLFWQGCLLTHIPVHLNQLGERAKLNVHGHLHSKTMADPRYYNVSCEQNDLTPINADVIMEHLKTFDHIDFI